MKINGADDVALVLVLVGGLNWGLVGAFEYNLVDSLFGEESTLARVVYVVVGLAALYLTVSMLTKVGKGEAKS